MTSRHWLYASDKAGRDRRPPIALELVVDNDPQGFVLPPELLKRFTQPWELFLEIPTGTSPMVLPYE